MRKALFILIFIVSASFLYANETNFRNTRWGMSVKDVSRKETAQFVKRINTANGPQLIYRSSVGGMKVRIIYDFNRNKLVKARYVFIVYDTDLGIEQYKTLKAILIKKYGPPEFSRRIIGGDKGSELASLSYLLLPVKVWVKQGLKNGKISIQSSWNAGNTGINLLLENKQDPELYILTVRYENLLWKEEQNKLKLQKEKSKEEALFKAL